MIESDSIRLNPTFDEIYFQNGRHECLAYAAQELPGLLLRGNTRGRTSASQATPMQMWMIAFTLPFDFFSGINTVPQRRTIEEFQDPVASN